MRITGPVTAPDAEQRSGRRPARRSAGAFVRGAAAAPLRGRARRELLFCLAGLPFGLVNPAVAFFIGVDLIWAVTPHRPPNPSWRDVAASIALTGPPPAPPWDAARAPEPGPLSRWARRGGPGRSRPRTSG